MTPERWQQVNRILQEAWERAGPQRNAYLDEVCGGDAVLRADVEELLAVDKDAAGFLERPPTALAWIRDAALGRTIDEVPSNSRQPDDLAGTRVGRYLIQGTIGKGGMGVVYRGVRQGDFHMEVAIKLLKRGTDTDAALERFRSERQILAGLQHPSIARLIDGGATEDGLPYLVMEYVDGTPLLQYAAPLSVRRRLELFRSLCSAVQYAHQNLIVHRDIKPSNILVTREGIPKLLDFGIAKLLSPGVDDFTVAMTMTGVRLMTPDYASPEQVRGEPVTTATDIYSLGAVLYELLTGQRAQHIETYSREAIEKEICGREPKPPSTVTGEVDADLNNITLMALRKEPQRRYGSVEQFSEDIRLYLEGRPVRARRDTTRYRASKFLRRNRLGVAISALASIGIITGVLAVNRQAHRAEYRFQQVRKLANTMLFDVEQNVATLAGSTKTRELIVKTALAYLDNLSLEAAGDPVLQLELATAYRHVGDVQGNPQISHLGQPKAAVESYTKALAIAEQLRSSPAALELIADTQNKLGAVYFWGLGRASDGVNHVRTAIAIADSIPKTGRPAFSLRAFTRGTLGEFLTYHDPSAALQPLRESVEISREWVSVQQDSLLIAAPNWDQDSRFHLALELGRLGAAEQQTGNLPQAMNDFAEALQLMEQLLQAQPDNAVLKRERAMYYERLAWVTGHPQYFNLGDREKALEWMRRYVPEMEALSSADPADLRARSDLCEALGELAAISGESDAAGAAKVYRRSLNLNASVLQATPEDSRMAFVQAFNRVGFAWVLDKLGRQLEAVDELNNAVELLQKLAREHADEARLPEYIGLALSTRGEQYLRVGNGQAAANDLDASRSILERLYAENPRKLVRLRDLADCYQACGDLDASRSEWKAAHAWYQRSLDLWDRWKDVGVSSVYDRHRRDVAATRVARAASKITVP